MDLMGEYNIPFDSSGHDSFNIAWSSSRNTPEMAMQTARLASERMAVLVATCHSHDCSYHSILAGLADLLKIDYKAETPAMKLAKMAAGLGYRFRVNEMYEGVEVQIIRRPLGILRRGIPVHYPWMKIRQKYPDAKMSRAKLGREH